MDQDILLSYKSYLPIVIVCFLFGIHDAQGQLITESDARLKTVKVRKEGFLNFFKKKKGFASSPQPEKAGKAKTPRYSSGSPFGFRVSKVNPKYSEGSPFDRKVSRPAPRYSQPVAFERFQYKPRPRYSQRVAFEKFQYRVRPRYSQRVAFEKFQYDVKPRYSKPVEYGKKLLNISPRYSQPMVFEKWQYKVRPRYSPGSPFAGQRYKVNPRYTIAKDFSIRKWWILRYEPIFLNPGIRKYKGPFLDHPVEPQGKASMNNFRGHWEIPSFRIFAWWNKSDKSDVDGTISKPKFDRKEREIWNN